MINVVIDLSHHNTVSSFDTVKGDGIVGISGWVFEMENLLRDLTPVARSQRLLITHGHFDPLLPFTEVRDQVTQLKAAGLNVTWRDYPKE